MGRSIVIARSHPQKDSKSINIVHDSNVNSPTNSKHKIHQQIFQTQASIKETEIVAKAKTQQHKTGPNSFYKNSSSIMNNRIISTIDQQGEKASQSNSKLTSTSSTKFSFCKYQINAVFCFANISVVMISTSVILSVGIGCSVCGVCVIQSYIIMSAFILGFYRIPCARPIPTPHPSTPLYVCMCMYSA